MSLKDQSRKPYSIKDYWVWLKETLSEIKKQYRDSKNEVTEYYPHGGREKTGDVYYVKLNHWCRRQTPTYDQKKEPIDERRLDLKDQKNQI